MIRASAGGILLSLPLILALPVILVSVPGNAEGACQPIRFKVGHFSATIRGMAPADGMKCYLLGTGAGQMATIRIKSRRTTVAFNVRGLVDNRDSYRFRTQRKTYRIDVYQWRRAVEPRSFTMFVSVR